MSINDKKHLHEMIENACDKKNNIILYHGSPNVVAKPYYKGGKPYNDYGYGFYCTPDEEIAKEWGAQQNNIGYCNKYTLDLNGLKVLNLNQSPYHTLNWLALLLANRKHNDIKRPNSREFKNRKYIIEHFTPDITDMDVIIGYRADDSYFRWAKDFVFDRITLPELELSMKLGNLGQQIVLVSEESFKHIKFLEYTEIQSYYLEQRNKRRDDATQAYFDLIDSYEESSTEITASKIREGALKNEHFCISRDVDRGCQQ